MENLEAIALEAGTNLEMTVKTTCFLADMAYFSGFNEILVEVEAIIELS